MVVRGAKLKRNDSNPPPPPPQTPLGDVCILNKVSFPKVPPTPSFSSPYQGLNPPPPPFPGVITTHCGLAKTSWT